MAVLIFNPNPVFDRTITVHELVPGAVMRTLDVELTAGGKGINVARVLRALGRKAPLLIPVGVADKVRYASLLADEGALAQIVEVEGPVRIASIYREKVSPRVTVVNDSGHPMKASDWLRTHEGVLASVAAGDIVLVMGSFPPGLGPEYLPALIADLHDVGVRVLLDVNPHWLAVSLRTHPDVVTPNLNEAEAVVSETSADVMDAQPHDQDAARVRAERAADSLCALGAQRAFVTAGAAGVAMADGAAVTWFPAHAVDVVSAVGAGDSFVAGLVHKWSATATADEVDWAGATRYGIATSANSCENVRAGGIDPARVAELLEGRQEVSAL
ncbi:MAG: PfkB family carbohydrate kinase [Chloroflexi bacterium]|nr:PfkB family carbohydrate kinase [Chloroflexota bacterium]